MTRDQAVQLIRGLCTALDPDGTPSTVTLNETSLGNGVGGVSIGEEAIYFEHHKANGSLTISVLIYRFRAKKPKVTVLEAFRAIEPNEDKGGASFDYQAANKSVFLSRTYEQPPAADALKADLMRVVAAAKRWRRQVVPKVAERANRGRNLS